MGKIQESAVVIQARTSSVRFPKKTMARVYDNMPLIEYVYERCKKSIAKDVLVATSIDDSDDDLYAYCLKNGISVFRGSLENVLERYIQAADSLGAKYIVRVCADTPFVDISLINLFLKVLVEENLDYVSADKNRCAGAFYCEAVTKQALKNVSALTKQSEDTEHVTRFIIKNSVDFLAKFIDVNLYPEFMKDYRLTVDYPEDMDRVRGIIEKLQDRFSFSSEEILEIVHNKQNKLY